MEKTAILNEIKIIELKLHALKTQVESQKPPLKFHTTENLYGLLRESEDITPDDIEAVKIKMKEPL